MPKATPAAVPLTKPAAPPRDLSLEERLTLVEATMTVRLDEAAVAYDVNTIHIDATPVDLDDVVTVPLTPTLQPPHPHSTPVAAALQRAHHRLLTHGWCTGTFQAEDGALCLYGALRFASQRDLGLEMDSVAVLMDVIRRQFGDRFESVPAFNDSLAGSDGRVAMRVLGQAADLAHARDL